MLIIIITLVSKIQYLVTDMKIKLLNFFLFWHAPIESVVKMCISRSGF